MTEVPVRFLRATYWPAGLVTVAGVGSAVTGEAVAVGAAAGAVLTGLTPIGGRDWVATG